MVKLEVKRKLVSSKGFSLVELIIAIAIMAILVGALAPALIKYVEKSRRARDVESAKAIESVLINSFSDGTIEVPAGLLKDGLGYGVWVVLSNKFPDKAPRTYRTYVHTPKSGMWCGANKGVIVDGKTSGGDWDYSNELEAIIKKDGLDTDTAQSMSNGSKDGWDWIIIEVGYDANGQLVSRIYSGFKNEDGGINKTPTSNIEKLMGRTWTAVKK